MSWQEDPFEFAQREGYEGAGQVDVGVVPGELGHYVDSGWPNSVVTFELDGRYWSVDATSGEGFVDDMSTIDFATIDDIALRVAELAVEKNPPPAVR